MLALQALTSCRSFMASVFRWQAWSYIFRKFYV